jgi:hypothetical protein
MERTVPSPSIGARLHGAGGLRHTTNSHRTRFLGHTTERQTAEYVRDKIGELTDPVSASPPEWMAKVLSPKTQSSA